MSRTLATVAAVATPIVLLGAVLLRAYLGVQPAVREVEAIAAVEASVSGLSLDERLEALDALAVAARTEDLEELRAVAASPLLSETARARLARVHGDPLAEAVRRELIAARASARLDRALVERGAVRIMDGGPTHRQSLGRFPTK